MSPQPSDIPRYQRAKEVLRRVLDVTPEERPAYLENACHGDAGLRREVESLLAAQEDVGSGFLESPITPNGGPSTDDDELDLTGQRLGAYRLERLLGRGGMGAVYLASRVDGEFAKRVAIKVIRPSMATPALLKRFRTERQILADIEHPHIAHLLDGGTAEGGMPYFVMEYVEGETLAEILHRGPLPLPTALRLAAEVADVLALIHSKGLVFRDLKPSNLMLDAHSRVKVLDFGIAKIMRGDVNDSATMETQPGWIVGSPDYMSPEQAMGEPAESSSDVFSFGIVLFEALTGRLPFDGDTREEYYRNLINSEARSLPLSFPREVRELTARCLKKARGERFASGAELAAAVRAITKGADSPKRAAFNRPLVWLGIAALIIVLIVEWPRWIGGRHVADAPPLGASQPIVTWASDESKPRVSPDLRRISFISDRDGVPKLWLRDRVSGAESVITPQGGELVGHEWAPSSDKVAYITWVGRRCILNISGITADARSDVFELNATGANIVRWIGEHIYFLAGRSLWRFDLGTRQSTEVTTERGTHRLYGVDVSADERHIIFTAPEPDFIRLLYADINGNNAVSLTDTNIFPVFPRWVGSRSDAFVFVSEENGQPDIWLMDVSSRHRRPLTVTGSREGGIDVSRDGSLLLYQRIVESASLGEINPSAKPPAIQALTSDSLGDISPSASTSASVVAFQRAKSENFVTGGDLYSATVRISRDRLATEPETVGDGYAPQVSLDGRWVAYLLGRGAAVGLNVYDVQERKTRAVSPYFFKPSFQLFPMAWTTANLVWSPTKPELYFVSAERAGHRSIVRAQVLPSPDPVTLESIVDVDDRTAKIGDLRMSSDGNRLSYVLTTASGAISELRVRDLVAGRESVLVREGASVTLGCPGWTLDDSIIVLRSDERMEHVDVLVRRVGGDPQGKAIGQLKGVDLGGLVLDPHRRILYFTHTDQGSSNLYSFQLDTRKEQLLRAGERYGGALSGIRVLDDGRLLFSLQKKHGDIYSNQLNR